MTTPFPVQPAKPAAFRSLRARIVMLVAVCFLPSAVLFALAMINASQLDTDRAQGEALRLTRLVDGQQDSVLDGLQDTLRAISLSAAVSGDNAAECSAYLRQVLAQNPRFVNVARLTAEGRFDCSTLPATPRPGPPATFTPAEHIRRAIATKTFAVSEYRVGAVTHKQQIVGVLPVLNDAGDVTFLVQAALNLDVFNRKFDSLSLPEGATATVIDREGVIVARYPDAATWTGRPFPDLAKIRAIQAKGEVEGRVAGADGVTRLYAFTSFGPADGGAVTMVGIPADTALATSQRMARNATLALVVGVLLVLTAGWFGSGAFVLRWVDKLAETVQRFAAGDRAARAQVPPSAGELYALAHAFNDLSDRLDVRDRELEASNQALREGEARYRLLADNSSDMIMRIRLDGSVAYVSPACFDLLGYPPEEYLTLGRAEVVHPDDLAAFAALRRKILAERSQAQSIIRTRHKDGHWVWMEVNQRAVVDANGAAAGVVSTLRDVSARKEAEREAAAATAALQEANRAKSAFLASMSHEIRTPLNGVMGFADLLMEGGLNPQQQHYAVMLKDAGGLLLTILNDVLDMSKIEAGKLELESIPLSIESIAGSVISIIGPQAKAKGLAVELKIAPTVAPWVMGDPTRLRQILLNLLANANKFTETGSIGLHISGECGALRFEVRDTGIGIPPERQHLLFQAFSQVDSSTTRTYGGTGLGLAICRSFVEAMGGAIGVTSTAGEGSVFWVMLNLPVTTAPAVAAAGPGETRTVRARILVAEDVDMNRVIVAALLKAIGHDVVMAINGKEAVETVQREEFDLILMDLQMPVMDGLEATVAIRALRGAVSRIPIVALTANVMAEDRARCRAAGMDDCLAKPVNRDALSRMVAKWARDQHGG